MLISSANQSSSPSPSSSPELADRLRLVIARTGRRLRQRAGAELSPSSAAALASVERLGPLSPSELADAERVSRPTITRVVARLEAAGLVAREPAEDDRRGVRIAITPAGRRLLRSLRTRKTAYLARRIQRLDAADRETLARAARILERMLDDDA